MTWQWVLASWRKHVSEAQHERESLSRGAKIWASSSLMRGWNSWLRYAGQRVHYLGLAAQIASSSATGLRALVWSAWTQTHRSSLALRINILAEHKRTVTRRWLVRLRKGCATSRHQKGALRLLAGQSATRVMMMHLHAWHELLEKKRGLVLKSKSHLGRVLHQQAAAGFLTWQAYSDATRQAKESMVRCLPQILTRRAPSAL